MNQITVVYKDSNGRKETNHPKLGKLISGKPFELDQETAKTYINSGLLTDPTGKVKPDPNPSEKTEKVSVEEVETKKKGGN